MGDYAVVKQEVVHGTAQDADGFLIALDYWFIGRVRRSHNKGSVRDLVK